MKKYLSIIIGCILLLNLNIALAQNNQDNSSEGTNVFFKINEEDNTNIKITVDLPSLTFDSIQTENGEFTYIEINDELNELTVRFRGNYAFIVRVFNEGVAYRFQTFMSDSVVVNRENLSLQLGGQVFAVGAKLVDIHRVGQ